MEPETRIIIVGDVLATAERLLISPAEACHLSIDERQALAAYALEADRIIRAAGLAYAGADAPDERSQA